MERLFDSRFSGATGEEMHMYKKVPTDLNFCEREQGDPFVFWKEHDIVKKSWRRALTVSRGRFTTARRRPTACRISAI